MSPDMSEHRGSRVPRILWPSLMGDQTVSELSNKFLFNSNSNTNDKKVYLTSSIFGDSCSDIAVNSSDLTNLCDGLTLTKDSPPTNFRTFDKLISHTENEDLSVKLEPITSSTDANTELMPSSISEADSTTIVSEQLPISPSNVVKKRDSFCIESPVLDSSHISSGDIVYPAIPANCTLQEDLKSVSSDGKISLLFLKQPERQHRARYQTEGSRGAIKDQQGNNFPIIQVRTDIYQLN